MGSNQEDSQKNEEDDLEEDYYLILNVPRNASDKEITQAYHRLGLAYHPDKHKDAESKRNAEQLFSKIKKVYDVLINPHKRAIYDSIGVKGLLQDDLQIMIRSKTPQEIRDEYERLSKEREQRRLESLTNSKGYFSLKADARKLFDESLDSEIESEKTDKESLIKLGNIEMFQSIDINLTNKDTITLNGNVEANGKFASQRISGEWTKTLSTDTIIKAQGTFGEGSKFVLSAFKRLNKKCNNEIKSVFKYKNGSVAPVFLNTLDYKLDDNLTGQLKFSSDIGFVNTSMSTALIYEKNKFIVSARVYLNLKNSYISLSLARSFLNNDVKLKSSIQYGYMGTTFTYGIEKQITNFSRLDASMVINSLSGVILNLDVQRGSQNFIIPIHLSSEIMPTAIFYGTVIPIGVYYVVKKLIVDPYVKQKDEEEAKLRQEKLKYETKEKRRLAIAAQTLMKEAVERIIEREGPNGLLIKKAIYGKLSEQDKSSNANFENGKVIDVAVPLQFLVQDHTLQIMNGESKSSLEGFYDPCIGENKELYIEYTFNGDMYKASFKDNEFISLPRSMHKVNWWSRPFSSVKS